jgi:large conductance mechanosensitive channel
MVSVGAPEKSRITPTRETPVTTPAPAVEHETFFGSFRKFLLETNALALAIAVVIAGAAGKLVTAITDGLLMPIVGLILPGGNWRELRIVLKAGVPGPDCPANLPMDPKCHVGETAIQVGSILGATLDFIIVALLVFIVAKRLLKMEVKR